MKIINAKCSRETESLAHPFSFKGNALTCLWQTVVYLKSENNEAIGLGVQSVLWADDRVFTALGEEQGNKLMFKVTEYAVKIIENMQVDSPKELFEFIFPKCLDYAKNLADGININETFVLNALVPVDNAAWMLYAKEKETKLFDCVIGENSFFENRESKLANIPLITYNTPYSQIIELADDGCCVFKIKIGSDPDKDGNRDKMLEWDKNRLREIHECLKNRRTPYTKDGHIYYYLDANCRYDTMERMRNFLDYAKEIGAFSRILLLEEPFFEGNSIYVGDMGVCVAADESIHDMNAVDRAIELGYGAMTLKPIAKTLSYTLDVLEKLEGRDIICFCADLTVNPIMVQWNKNVAARLKKFPQLYVGLLESNGAQNYSHWDTMQSFDISANKSFSKITKGVYKLNDEFYQTSGGIFEIPLHYLKIVKSDL